MTSPRDSVRSFSSRCQFAQNARNRTQLHFLTSTEGSGEEGGKKDVNANQSDDDDDDESILHVLLSSLQIALAR